MQKEQSQKVKKTTSLQRFGYLLGTFFFGIVTWTTGTGELQNHIHFAGIANEIGFFVMGSMLTGIFAIMTCSE